MGINDLQTFLEKLEGGTVSVDFLKIARNVTQRQQPHNINRKIRPIGNKLKLIVDSENCLDRLYGGHFSDWACGGQWNRMVEFLSELTQAIKSGNIELAVVFNGTIDQCRMNEWIAEQAKVRKNVEMVLKHINTKATQPPKIWWNPPICLRASLRLALRYLEVPVMCTMDDHHQEVIAYCREYGFHGLLADDAEYAAFDPPRYFSSENLKLTYKGSIETKEYMISELTKKLKITQEHVCIMAALLGNFLLPENDLQDLYKKLNFIKVTPKTSSENNIKKLAEYVSTLPSVSNMDSLVTAVFGSLEDKRSLKFKQSVQYYLNGTANGFLKYCIPPENLTISESENYDLDTPGFASETTEQEQKTMQNYRQVTAHSVSSEFEGLFKNTKNGKFGSDSSRFKDSSVKNLASTSGRWVNISPGITNPTTVSKYNKSSISSNPITPTITPEISRITSIRHQKGLMSPFILHVLYTQEIRLPCLMEDEVNREFPPIHDIYQSLRKKIYAVLFNLHHLRYVHSKKKESGEVPENTPQPDIIVKEWIYSESNPYQYPVLIKAEPLPWAVPTIYKLWVSPSDDDKRRRMRTLLTCLNSDTSLILNTAYVPQHMLIMACVLRYIMSQDKPILRRHELDAFLCHAFNPNLMNSQYLHELALEDVTSRGVQLATLFMNGVDMALIANDACGAPLPWLMCCPWLYFDGKLFHYTLTISSQAKNILEVCENYVETVAKVEQMKNAILEGLDVKFAKVPFTGPPMLHTIPPPLYPPNIGSFGSNFGYQDGVGQMVPGGYNMHGGRGPGWTNNPRGGYQNAFGAGRGQNRRPGMPNFPVNAINIQVGEKRKLMSMDIGKPNEKQGKFF